MKKNQPDSTRFILIVEDEPICQQIYLLALTKLGYHVDLAGTADEAKSCLAKRAYDCILLDLGLPDQSGDELIPVIRQDSLNQATPIIVISAHVDAKLKERCLLLGANLVWTKPISVVSLTHQIQNYLDPSKP